MFEEETFVGRQWFIPVFLALQKRNNYFITAALNFYGAIRLFLCAFNAWHYFVPAFFTVHLFIHLLKKRKTTAVPFAGYREFIFR